MKTKQIIIAVLLCLTAGPAHPEVIEFPDDQFWRNLSQVFAEETPDYDQIARRTPEYRQADEFDKGDVLAEQVLKLKRMKADFGSDEQVLFRAAIRLDDYDAERGGFEAVTIESSLRQSYADARGGVGNKADVKLTTPDYCFRQTKQLRLFLCKTEVASLLLPA
ncbi:hypothetical protein K7H91_18555 [Martelella mediterranea]|uniref:hypothetical protein n=1 Tax=Martelella mediterranea TaxID=293089 RepID=UPI001E63DF42|nr:hypothetical protein [Martelella mediterranea]MCD1635773.1 hypothetical protein [Martelella mediterranea]